MKEIVEICDLQKNSKMETGKYKFDNSDVASKKITFPET